MMVSGHQPNLLPWLGYFDKMQKSDIFVIADDVQFERKSYANRNSIIIDGNPHRFTFPVKHSSVSTAYSEMHYSEGDWIQHFRTQIEQAYPCEHAKEIAEIIVNIAEKDSSLLNVNLALIEWLRSELDVDTPLILQSSLGLTAQGRSERLLERCKKLKADTYLAGSGSTQYLDKSLFESEGISVIIQDFKHPTYRQRTKKFVPYMSALDYVLCNPGRTLKDLMLAE
jgi:hypothetical protein